MKGDAKAEKRQKAFEPKRGRYRPCPGGERACSLPVLRPHGVLNP